jgi:hypothetical protein
LQRMQLKELWGQLLAGATARRAPLFSDRPSDFQVHCTRRWLIF